MVLLSLIPFFNILVFAAGIIIPIFMAIDGDVRFRKSGSKFFEYLNGRLWIDKIRLKSEYFWLLIFRLLKASDASR